MWAGQKHVHPASTYTPTLYPWAPASKRGQRRTETGERRSPDRSRLLGWRVLRAGTRSSRTRPGCRPRQRSGPKNKHSSGHFSAARTTSCHPGMWPLRAAGAARIPKFTPARGNCLAAIDSSRYRRLGENSRRRCTAPILSHPQSPSERPSQALGEEHRVLFHHQAGSSCWQLAAPCPQGGAIRR